MQYHRQHVDCSALTSSDTSSQVPARYYIHPNPLSGQRAMAEDSTVEGHAGTSTSRTAGGEGSMPGVGDLRAMMRDTLREILPEILGDRTAREGPSKEPHPSGSSLGRMPSGDALSGMRIATFGEAGLSHSVAVNPQATTPELGTETIAG